MYESLRGLKIGYALTGSFCTFEKSFAQAKILADTDNVRKRCGDIHAVRHG